MNEAFYTILGVIIGTFIPWLKEWLREKQQRKKHAEYLAVRLVCLLDEYVDKCIDVVQDNGTYKGQAAHRDENGEEYYIPQVPLPEPPAYPEDIDWKSIDGELMYQLLSFPNEVKETNKCVEHAYLLADPPEYDELFKARENGYSSLGLTAYRLSEKLCKTYDIPKRNRDQGWDPAKHLKDVMDKQKIIEERWKRDKK